MKIICTSLIEGAKNAKGLTVIIDVFRACTTAAYALSNGADKILPVCTVEEVFNIKKNNPDYILMGEVGGKKVEGFDYGNSPSSIKKVNFTGKTIVFRTNAGTRGIVNAVNAEEILVGNFVNMQATINHIKIKDPETVTLVAMGNATDSKRDEDELCAKYIKDSLEERQPDFNEIKDYLRAYEGGLKFFNPSKPHFPEEDFECALDFNKFDFVLKVIKKENCLQIIKHP